MINFILYLNLSLLFIIHYKCMMFLFFFFLKLFSLFFNHLIHIIYSKSSHKYLEFTSIFLFYQKNIFFTCNDIVNIFFHFDKFGIVSILNIYCI